MCRYKEVNIWIWFRSCTNNGIPRQEMSLLCLKVELQTSRLQVFTADAISSRE
ncbi:Uncharacterized protein APZ42_020306 [Daphnia magna]|uniref:Uncharacterized protein n=1 Tax=Daphnia magna TaxID=35525 RepID=A0A164XK48_9CRUS|nr:Uncharacterized protein APZ42_020306 [Daphnia magna]